MFCFRVWFFFLPFFFSNKTWWINLKNLPFFFLNKWCEFGHAMETVCLYAWVVDGSSLDEPKTFELLNSREMSGAVADRMKYLTKRGKSLCMSAQMCVCVCNNNKGDFYSSHLPHWIRVQGTLHTHTPMHTHTHTHTRTHTRTHTHAKSEHVCEKVSLEIITEQVCLEGPQLKRKDQFETNCLKQLGQCKKPFFRCLGGSVHVLGDCTFGLFPDGERAFIMTVGCVFFIKNLCTHYHCDECAFSITGLFSDKECAFFRWRVHALSITKLFQDEKSVHSVSLWIVFRWRV